MAIKATPTQKASKPSVATPAKKTSKPVAASKTLSPTKLEKNIPKQKTKIEKPSASVSSSNAKPIKSGFGKKEIPGPAASKPNKPSPVSKFIEISKPIPVAAKSVEKPANQPKPTAVAQNPSSPSPKPNIAKAKSRYSDVELAEFRILVNEKLSFARQELNYLQEQIVEMNENNSDIQGSDWFDDSSIHSEVELLNNMAIRQRQFIQNLENAMVRIENKTYGICAITGNLIDKKRLLLVPHATKSIEAKNIEQATVVPDINQVAPDQRVIRRAIEGKQLKKAGVKKVKNKSARDYDDDELDELADAPIEEMDIAFEGGDD